MKSGVFYKYYKYFSHRGKCVLGDSNSYKENVKFSYTSFSPIISHHVYDRLTKKKKNHCAWKTNSIQKQLKYIFFLHDFKCFMCAFRT